MSYIQLKIRGISYSQQKNRGRVQAPKVWTDSIISQTLPLPKIKEACIVRLTFLLPENKFPPDYPYGPDLDNLTKRFLDVLNKTVFSEVKGRDSCVFSFHVIKTKVSADEDAGTLLEILPVSLTH